MKHRLFIGIPFPPSFVRPVQNVLGLVGSKLPADTFRFVHPDLWHITLLFLGDQEEEDLADIISAIQSLELPESFEEVFEGVDYGPDKRNPRMIWLWGSPVLSKRLEILRDDLQDALIEYGVPFAPDNRKFTAHITLARSAVDRPRVAPEIRESLKVPALVDEVQLVESVLTAEGPEYTVFGVFPLKID